MKIISWYAHKEKGNKKEEERINLEKSPAKSLFKIKKNKKETENVEDVKE
ncbi:hypothetical protein [Halalkalibacter alkalisediminis]|uniref:Uncharacterized protein n=1 Tax=Halalkalibacter alkalisediminis TaxID=935616 RepID=A0ABV6NGX2_9BACI|nr:hypothetical protein [Halalkalibacter alkalisediminis]